MVKKIIITKYGGTVFQKDSSVIFLQDICTGKQDIWFMSILWRLDLQDFDTCTKEKSPEVLAFKPQKQLAMAIFMAVNGVATGLCKLKCANQTQENALKHVYGQTHTENYMPGISYRIQNQTCEIGH